MSAVLRYPLEFMSNQESMNVPSPQWYLPNLCLSSLKYSHAIAPADSYLYRDVLCVNVLSSENKSISSKNNIKLLTEELIETTDFLLRIGILTVSGITLITIKCTKVASEGINHSPNSFFLLYKRHQLRLSPGRRTTTVQLKTLFRLGLISASFHTNVWQPLPSIKKEDL